MKALRIGIYGTRGVPARYGGFETFAEQLGARLVQRGHQVSVFSRSAIGTRRALEEYRGMKVRFTPTVMHKYLETPLHALSSFFLSSRHEFDIALLCNAANSPFSWILRLKGIPLITNVDGIERKRAKWNALGRFWYRLGEQSAVLFSNRVVSDADVIAQYYKESYGCHSTVIRYGADARPVCSGGVLTKFGLQPQKYLLYVSRLEPENNALGVVQAFSSIHSAMPLVIVGDAPYAKDYIAAVKSAANSQVVFTGYQFEESYRELRSNCYAYVQATEVGGTHPALVEAMAYSNCVIANDVPEHREVLQECGLYYSKNNFSELAKCFQKVLSEPELVKKLGHMAYARSAAEYNWDKICDDYLKVFEEVLKLPK